MLRGDDVLSSDVIRLVDNTYSRQPAVPEMFIIFCAVF